jgi:hypothetical protein
MKLVDTFQTLTDAIPDAGLRARILARLGTEQQRLLSVRRRWSVAGVMVSGLIFFGAWFQYSDALVQSDFWLLSSLLFSDLGAIMVSSQDFAFSLLETLPVIPLLVLMAPLALFFWSMSLIISLSEKPMAREFYY